jgi:transcriptional regulator
MYIPKHFRVEDFEAIKNFISQNSFGVLITQHDNKPWATHLPIELETNNKNETVLRGHVAKGNLQWKAFEKNENALAIFSGPHSYVSSSWYNHLNVPTWNYIAVHITGTLRLLTDDELYDSLKKLVDKYEVVSANPVTVDGMKKHTLKEIKGIAGFEMTIEKMQGKWKLSQNRNEDDFKNIITELEKLNDMQTLNIAEEMRKLKR